MEVDTQGSRNLTASSSEESSPTRSTSSKATSVEEVEQIAENNNTRLSPEGSSNPEKDLSKPLPGWPELATVIAKNRDFEAFQVFRDLSAKSLLYYQAQLVDLRKDLHGLEWRNNREGRFKDAGKLNSRADLLVLTESDDDDDTREQMDLVNKIREVLKDYYAALLQYSQINSLPEADPINVKSLRTWIEDPQLGNMPISGPGSATWGKLLARSDSQPSPLTQEFFDVVWSLFGSKQPEKDDLDLVVPCKVEKLDGFTRWIATKVVPFWQHYKDRKSSFWKILWTEIRGKAKEVDEEKDHSSAKTRKTRKKSSSIKERIFWLFSWNKGNEKPPEAKSVPTIQTYSNKSMRKITLRAATLIACLLPIVAIGVLSTMHRTAEIIGFITLFVAIFAIGLMCVADADTKRTDIFTATAAFSAVLVVFVQGQNSGTGITIPPDPDPDPELPPRSISAAPSPIPAPIPELIMRGEADAADLDPDPDAKARSGYGEGELWFEVEVGFGVKEEGNEAGVLCGGGEGWKEAGAVPHVVWVLILLLADW
ncbi:hypothetical protein EG329_009905 [Mollisiaceae sp. DMI_Dod_QoI]|nr:hypothetical protein EG329_009905 [Helotiales sp. DMI_Dod_QoI]